VPHFAVHRAPAGVGSSKGVLSAAAELDDDEEDSSAAYEVAARSAVESTVDNLMVGKQSCCRNYLISTSKIM
jgi:hypothetical protein